MIRLIASRIGQVLFVTLAVAFIAFLMFRFIGGPISAMAGPELSLQQCDELIRKLGLDQPTLVQFARFVAHAAQGDFGYFYRLSRPVAEIIAARLPATVELTLVAFIIALVLGVPLGVFTALKMRSVAAKTVLASSLIGISVPTFVIGLALGVGTLGRSRAR